MTVKEGKSFLADRMRRCGCKTSIDDVIVYTYGNRKEADDYQHDEISGNIDFREVPTTVRLVVKCFLHQEVYVAWQQETCRGRGKCIVYKRDLVAFDKDKDCDFNITTRNDGTSSYWFRGASGTDKFIKTILEQP